MATKSKTSPRKAPARRKPVRRRSASRGLSGMETDAVQAKWLNRALIGAVGVGVLGGGYLLLKKGYNAVIVEPKRIKQINESQTFGTPAYFAGQLELAFHPSGSTNVSDWFGDGTDEEKVLNILKTIPNRATYEQMMNSYKSQTGGRNFGDDLKSEMTSIWSNADYDAALKIISTYK